MTKQYALFAVLPFMFLTVLRNGKPRTEFVAVVLLVALVISTPFILTNKALAGYLSNVWMTRSKVDDWPWRHFLSEFTANQFCGFFQIAAFISDLAGMEFGLFTGLSYFGFVCLGLGTIWSSVLALRGILSPNQALLSGLTVFLVSSWYVNPQYTLSVIPFLLLDIFSNRRRTMWLLIAFLPNLWPFLAYGLLYNFSTYAPVWYPATNMLQPLRDLMFTPIGYHSLVLRNTLVPATGFLFSFLLCVYLLRFLWRGGLMSGLKRHEAGCLQRAVRRSSCRTWIRVLK
jgi:hypothetical protein